MTANFITAVISSLRGRSESRGEFLMTFRHMNDGIKIYEDIKILIIGGTETRFN